MAALPDRRKNGKIPTHVLAIRSSARKSNGVAGCPPANPILVMRDSIDQRTAAAPKYPAVRPIILVMALLFTLPRAAQAVAAPFQSIAKIFSPPGSVESAPLE